MDITVTEWLFAALNLLLIIGGIALVGFLIYKICKIAKRK